MFIVTHKEIDNKVEKPNYFYIAVGKKIGNCDFQDSTLDNISDKNGSYCELTALYWIWKNLQIDNVGLCHYRRFFAKNEENNFVLPSIEQFNDILKKYDIVLPRKSTFKDNNLCTFELVHRNNSLRKICKMIVDRDNSYKNPVKKFLHEKRMHCFNMFYCSKKTIDKYCAWLFDILFDFEKIVNLDSLDSYNKRLFGFLSERLFNIWVIHEKLNVFEYDVVETEIFPLKKSSAVSFPKPSGIIYMIKKIYRLVLPKKFLKHNFYK